ncbi:hypothetical protein D9M71_206700 [compost metagenome]
MRTAFGIHRGEGHGVGFDRQLLGLHGITEPVLEQAEGLGGSLVLAEPVTGVVAAHVGQGLGHFGISLSAGPFSLPRT